MAVVKAGGMFLVAMGLLWVLQGTGIIEWPPGGFMIAQTRWVYCGGLIAFSGAALVWWAARHRQG